MKCLMYCSSTTEFVKFGTCRPFGFKFTKDGISYLILQIDVEDWWDHYISKDVIRRRLGKYADT